MKPAAPNIPFTKTNASVLLDLVRGLAALLVLLEHWRNFVFVDFGQIANHKASLAALYLLSTAGHQAVVIFFVLSGYLIGGSIFRSLRADTWDWKKYLTHRLLRLWIVLIPGLLLCALCDSTALHLHLSPQLYTPQSSSHMVGDVARNLRVGVFFGNLFFLQTILVPVFASDSPLWSLAFEFWYYLLFPLGLFACRRQTKASPRILCVLLFGVIAWFVGAGVMLGFPCWLAGALLAVVRPPKLRPWAVFAAALAYLPLFFGLQRVLHLPGTAADYLLTLPTFGLLWSILSVLTPARSSTGVMLTRNLSRCSFTLYVDHTPLCLFLTAWFVGETRWQPTPVHLAAGFAILLLLLGTTYGIAALTEFHTDAVRRWLETRLFKKQNGIRKRTPSRQ